jgi:hypothetical protein
MEPLPDDTIDTNVEHEAEERPPLRDAYRLQRARHSCPQRDKPSLRCSRTVPANEANLDPPRSQPRFQGIAPNLGHHRLSSSPGRSGTEVPVLPMQAAAAVWPP